MAVFNHRVVNVAMALSANFIRAMTVPRRYRPAVRVLIIGCGYLGVPLGIALRQAGHEVAGLRRSGDRGGELTRHGITPIAADITQSDSLAQISGQFDWVVHSVSSSRGGLGVFQEVFDRGTRNLLDWLKTRPPKSYVFTGSTSVYGQTDGKVVDESSATIPVSETGRVLLDTERLIREAHRDWGLPAKLLRVSGIYGPGRTWHLQRCLGAKPETAGGDGRILNMIHRVDLMRAVMVALQKDHAGKTFNVTDDEPVSELVLFVWLAKSLHWKRLPKVEGARPADRKRGITSKRVSNRKFKETFGFQLEFPTFREGLAQELEREEAGS